MATTTPPISITCIAMKSSNTPVRSRIVFVDPASRFPAGFFRRQDESDDAGFYRPNRLVTHIDDGAIRVVGTLYEELGIGTGSKSPVLDLMSSWVSHFRERPEALTVLGMNDHELLANEMATTRVVHDLNRVPVLPFSDGSFGAAVCCVSVDYLVRPFEVFSEVARVLSPSAPFVCTFSNRCFPTKVIQGWLTLNDRGRSELVADYFRSALVKGSPAFAGPTVRRCTPLDASGDPIIAVLAERAGP